MRFCFSAVITSAGLLDGSLWLFCPNRSTGDYHRSFNSTNFKQYFVGGMRGQNEHDPPCGMMDSFERAFPGRRALFVMDNAS